MAGTWWTEHTGPPVVLHPDEPPTTTRLAAAGTPLGLPGDMLRVAAMIRCRTERDVLGAVLYLDRAARGLGPYGRKVWEAANRRTERYRGLAYRSSSHPCYSPYVTELDPAYAWAADLATDD